MCRWRGYGFQTIWSGKGYMVFKPFGLVEGMVFKPFGLVEGMVFKPFGLVKGMVFKPFGLVQGPVKRDHSQKTEIKNN